MEEHYSILGIFIIPRSVQNHHPIHLLTNTFTISKVVVGSNFLQTIYQIICNEEHVLKLSEFAISLWNKNVVVVYIWKAFDKVHRFSFCSYMVYFISFFHTGAFKFGIRKSFSLSTRAETSVFKGALFSPVLYYMLYRIFPKKISY